MSAERLSGCVKCGRKAILARYSVWLVGVIMYMELVSLQGEENFKIRIISEK